jgi:hypothetical protein
MELSIPSNPPTLEETIESLAQTVAHLALQLTVAQLQLRALGTVLAETSTVSADDVLARSARLAEEHAGSFLSGNLGPALVDLVDMPELERQIIEYLAVQPDA